MLKRIALSLVSVAFLLALIPPASLWGQTATGQITGTVKDPSGAVMPGVKVTVSNEATGFSRTATSDGSGAYSFPLLPPDSTHCLRNKPASASISAHKSD